jgi:hypothetical protein
MKYFFYEVVLPLLLVVLVYFPGGLILLRGEPNLFEKVFAPGDLYGISALILISSFVELDRAQLELGRESFGVHKAVSFVSGMVIFTAYLLMKVTALHLEFDAKPLPTEITWYAWASIGCLAYTAILGGFLRYRTAKARRHVQSDSARGGRPVAVLTLSSFIDW